MAACLLTVTGEHPRRSLPLNIYAVFLEGSQLGSTVMGTYSCCRRPPFGV